MGVTQKDTKKDTKKEKTHTVASLTARQFDEFWRTYPSRRSHSNPKKPARAKFDAALKRGATAAEIIRGAQNYAAYVERESTDPKYVAQAKTWLNEERWTQYQEQEAAGSKPAPLML
jgi:predicted transposase YbfD/YdcC